jgi:hypothetical protein
MLYEKNRRGVKNAEIALNEQKGAAKRLPPTFRTTHLAVDFGTTIRARKGRSKYPPD